MGWDRMADGKSRLPTAAGCDNDISIDSCIPICLDRVLCLHHSETQVVKPSAAMHNHLSLNIPSAADRRR